MRQPACVAIPIYRAALNPYEKIALTQCARILGTHPMVFVKPHSLDVSELQGQWPHIGAISFNDHFFANVRGYNALMLSAAFYEAFEKYEHVLIHQLDAFVFRDELADWCARGYDYIGAPWLKRRIFSSQPNKLRLRLKKVLYEKLGVTKRDGFTPHSARVNFCVGNGGFSLRRVAAFLRVIKRFGPDIREFLKLDPPLNEDLFYSLVVNRHGRHLHIPDYRTASRFAVETAPKEVIMRFNGGKLPFGCHAWEKMDIDYWREVFLRCGYAI